VLDGATASSSASRAERRASLSRERDCQSSTAKTAAMDDHRQRRRDGMPAAARFSRKAQARSSLLPARVLTGTHVQATAGRAGLTGHRRQDPSLPRASAQGLITMSRRFRRAWMRKRETTGSTGGVMQMTLHPKIPRDMALAPVAAEIDLNLQGLRDKGLSELDTELQLELNGPPIPNTRDMRAAQVLRASFRDVDLHGWQGSITTDGCRLHLTGGSVTLDLGLGASIMEYIETGIG
jgi:hypothetical protein